MGTFDVVIIGGGPAGLRLAGNLSGKGFRTALFESKPTLEDKTLRAIRKKIFDGWNLNGCIWSVCRGIRLHSLHATKASEDTQFYFVEFGSMLKAFLRRVSSIALNFSHTVLDIVSERDKVTLRVQGPKGVTKHFCQILVACDGVNGVSRRIFGGGPSFVKAVEYRLADRSAEPGYFDLFYTHRFHPGGYGWVRNLENEVDVGLAVTQDPVRLLNEFIREHFISKREEICEEEKD
jgi:flavin-dependent dehydrogenase